MLPNPQHDRINLFINIAAAILIATDALTGALQPLLPLPLYETMAAFLVSANGVLRALNAIKQLPDE